MRVSFKIIPDFAETITLHTTRRFFNFFFCSSKMNCIREKYMRFKNHMQILRMYSYKKNDIHTHIIVLVMLFAQQTLLRNFNDKK